MKDIKRGNRISYLTFSGYDHFLDGLPVSENDLTTGIVIARALNAAGETSGIFIKEEVTGRTYTIGIKRIMAVLDE